MELHPLTAASLETLRVPHEVLPCDPALADTTAFCEAYGIDPADSANTIVVSSRRPPGVEVACVVLATTRLDVNRRVRSMLDVRKLSFASGERTVDLTGMMIGGVTPFGLPDDLRVLVDEAVMHRPRIVLGAGTRSAKLSLEPAALLMLPMVEVVSGLAMPAGDGPE
jgi:prolyl-tRNA editing enzyme YbaK/EbsC (Cys-tRNA(Pro) deacylase)